MNNFPAELGQETDIVATLDPSRCLIALPEPQELEAVKQQLRTVGAELEPGQEDDGRAQEIINHTDQRFWCRIQADPGANTDIFDRVVEAFGGQLDWIGPVYRRRGVTGRLGLHCPLPNSLILKVTGTDTARLQDLAERLSIREGDVADQPRHQENPGGYRRYILGNPQELNSYQLRILLLEEAADTVSEVLFENMPLVSPLAIQLTDPLSDLQWNMNRIRAQDPDPNVVSGWNYSLGRKDITVCIMDTGCDLTHPDLWTLHGLSVGAPNGVGENRIVPNFSFGHGTMCAGVAAATANNMKGLAGVAGRCTILPVAIKNFTEWDIYTGVVYAVDHGARVINMSFHDYSWTPNLFNAATKYAHDRDVVICAATGNNNQNKIGLPASDPLVIACGASTRITPEDRIDIPDVSSPGKAVKKGWGSNYGAALSVVAPGIEIPTTVVTGSGTEGAPYGPDYTGGFGGTSAATPHVAGLAALILSVRPTLTSEQVRYIIESTADKVGVNKFDHPKSHPNGSWNQFVGYGRINVLKAVWKATNALFIEARIEATHLQKLALALRAHKKELARDDREDVDPAAGALHETWIRLGSDPGILKLIHDVIQDPGIAYSLRQDHAPLLKDRGIALPEGASVVVIDKVTHEGAQACPVLRIEFTVAGIKCAAEWDPELGFSGETLSPLPGLHKAEVQTAATTREPAGIAGLPGRSVSMQD